MTDPPTDAPTSRDRGDADPPAPWASPLVAVVTEYEDEPDECTIFPGEADDDELVTTWITAGEGSFVALDEMR